MSLLATATKGKIRMPDLIVIYGVDGVGKSTFAANAPKPIFVGPEKGTANLNVTRLPGMDSYPAIMSAIDALINEEHDFETVALDSLDHIEPLVWAQVCKDAGVTSIENAYGGYGKGYVAAIQLWQALLNKLTILREKRKMNIIAIAHAQVKAFNDPQQNASYDRFQLKLNDKASALWREFVDCVFFANFEVYTKTDAQKKTRAYGEGVRLIHTSRMPGYDAKNRYDLPNVLPLDWGQYQIAKAKGNPEAPESVMKNIQELLEQVTDPELKTKVTSAIEDAAGKIDKLMVIQNRLRTLLSQ